MPASFLSTVAPFPLVSLYRFAVPTICFVLAILNGLCLPHEVLLPASPAAHFAHNTRPGSTTAKCLGMRREKLSGTSAGKSAGERPQKNPGKTPGQTPPAIPTGPSPPGQSHINFRVTLRPCIPTRHPRRCYNSRTKNSAPRTGGTPLCRWRAAQNAAAGNRPAVGYESPSK